ncbi:MAG: hypothetical protein WCV67_10180 [Victivallaceae bacterium]|jgi:hypothetical protein
MNLSIKKVLLCCAVLVCAAAATSVFAKAICPGVIDSGGKCTGWRYMDSDFFGNPRIVEVKGPGGKDIKAAVLMPALKNTRLFIMTGSFGPEPASSPDIGIQIITKIEGADPALPLMAQLSYAADGFKLGKASQPVKLPEGEDIGNGWRMIKIPVSAFGIKDGTVIKRVHVFLESQNEAPETARVLVNEISIIHQPGLVYKALATEESAAPAAKARRYCSIFPKPYWHTDTKTFYAPEVYKMLYDDGFNVIGVPGISIYSRPEELPERVVRYIATGKAASKYPGMLTYPKITMCWQYPDDVGGRYSKVVWFNGYEANLPCPVDDAYWNERIIPYCLAYAKASKETPTFAVMLDWEIYIKNKFRSVYGLCYCDKCWSRFLQESAVKAPELAFNDRNSWLIKNDLRLKYSQSYYKHLRQLGTRLRNETDKINPELSYWFIPAVSDSFMTELGRVMATRQAPLIVTNEDTYGKPSLALSNDEGIKSVVSKVESDLASLRKSGIPFVYMAAIMADQDPVFHGRQAIEMAKLCDGIWVWELGKESDYKYGRRNVMNILKSANEEIRSGTFKTPAGWLQDTKSEKTTIPAGQKGVGLSGIQIKTFKLPDTAYPYELKELSSDNLKDIRLVILQNFNASLDAGSPVVNMLREYVSNGGSLFLTHDTGYFMASPFPEIVKGYIIPPEQGDSRHILDTKIVISKQCIPSPSFGGREFDSSFNDHLVFEAGLEGSVLARDKYNYPVIISGQFGKGKVIFSGCYYHNIKEDALESRFTKSLVDWLFNTN